jgi:hypothetical protein
MIVAGFFIKNAFNNRVYTLFLTTNSTQECNENLWLKKDSFFPEIIIFCPEIEQQIKTIDKTIFTVAQSHKKPTK